MAGCPFPGMDPWLEDPLLWPGVHHALITYARDQLVRKLPAPLYVEIGERVYVEDPGARRDIVPDAAVVQPPRRRPRGPGTSAAIAEPEALDEPWLVHVGAVEVTEGFLEIRHPKAGDAVLTVIEVLSPTNKRPGPGRDLYLQKQAEVLRSRASLVEIDLLRAGEPSTACPVERLPAGPYRVVVTRGWDRAHREVYPVQLRDRLPRFALPLRHDLPDVSLDLPALFGQVYENAGYGGRLDYDAEPAPPLPTGDLAWARERVAAARAG